MRSILMTLLVVAAIVSSINAQDTEREANPLVQSNNKFAFNLYHTVAENNENMVFSPYSILQALGMLHAGTRNETQAQMATALTLPEGEIDNYFADLYAVLTAPPEYEDILFQLNIANALWAQDGYTLHTDYLDLLTNYYNAELREVDFAQSEATMQLINETISEQTNGRIDDLIASLDPQTRLMLTNAIYLNAGWLLMFDQNETQEGTFTLLDGSQVTVPMMHMDNQFYYVGTEHYQALQLEYQARQFGMLVIVPDEGQFEAVESMLSAEFFATVQSQLIMPYNVRLRLPRFEYETTLDLTQILKELGMTAIFSTDADFSGIADEPLFINSATHSAFINVNEQGTEAAAATALGVGGGGPPNVPIEVNVDRPFIYIIYHRTYEDASYGRSGVVLFVGRVLNPASD